MKFMRRHMWIGGALLIIAAAGYLLYYASYRLGYFAASN